MARKWWERLLGLPSVEDDPETDPHYDREGPPAHPEYWTERGFVRPSMMAVAWRWYEIDDNGNPLRPDGEAHV
jgi:hypothetical protein